MTRRQQIVDAFEQRLRGIFVSSGYRTDLGANVEGWRSRPLADGEIFAVVWRDTAAPKRREGVEIGRHEHELSLEVEILVADGTPDATAREMLADVVQAVGADPRFGGLARWTKLEEDELIVHHEGVRLAAVRLRFAISYRTALWEV